VREREREREREEALELLSSLIMASLLKDFRREEKLRLAGCGWLSPFLQRKSAAIFRSMMMQKRSHSFEVQVVAKFCQPKIWVVEF
jgi:hypothetical protein